MLAQSALVRLAPLALLFSIACGSSVVDDGAGGDGGTGAGGGDGGQGGSGGNVDPACVPFLDAEPESSITIRFVNQSGQDVYLPATCGLLDYQISREAGQDGVTYGRTGGSCTQSCELLQNEDPVLCEEAACAPSSILLQNGETVEVVWDGRGVRATDMPLDCWYSGDAGTACNQIVNASPGVYFVSQLGFESCGEGCTCDADGVCTGDVTGMEAYPEAPSVTLPTEGVVELVFGVCSFPCPGGDAGGK